MNDTFGKCMAGWFAVVSIAFLGALAAMALDEPVRSHELTTFERAIEVARVELLSRQGYAGPWAGSCTAVDDAIACSVRPEPLLPASTCDDCNKAGGIVCGPGKVDKSQTKKALSGGCSGMCKGGGYWVVECAKAKP